MKDTIKDMRNNQIENGSLCLRSRPIYGGSVMGYALVISNKLFWKDDWNDYLSTYDKLNLRQLIVIEHLTDNEKKMRKDWLELMATTKSKKVKDEDREIVKRLLSEM